MGTDVSLYPYNKARGNIERSTSIVVESDKKQGPSRAGKSLELLLGDLEIYHLFLCNFGKFFRKQNGQIIPAAIEDTVNVCGVFRQVIENQIVTAHQIPIYNV